jgi:signal transduction histidine kinase
MRNSIYKDYLFSKAKLLFLECDVSGNIITANNFASSIIDFKKISNNIYNLIIDFHNTFDLSKLTVFPDKQHLFNINSFLDTPVSLYFNFYKYKNSYLIFASYDVNEFFSFEKKITKLNNELNTLTRELYKKNNELNKLNIEKNKFLGMAAHDLRGLIMSINGSAEIMYDELKDSLNEEHSEFLNIIRYSSDNMLKIINNYLDASAIESGIFELNLSSIRLSEIIKKSISLNKLIAKKKNITIHSEHINDNKEIFADESMIEQVLNNLLSNAIKYSMNDTEIFIKSVVKKDNCIVSISDIGVGIKDEEIQNIFKSFYKSNHNDINKEKSSGLGLAIVKKIIDLHKGNIWVESKTDIGTTVYFTLPI